MDGSIRFSMIIYSYKKTTFRLLVRLSQRAFPKFFKKFFAGLQNVSECLPCLLYYSCVPGNTKTTSECERRIAMYCLKCGYKIPAGALFCPNCGAKVQAAAPTQPSAVLSGAAQPETDVQPNAGSSEQNEQSTAQTRQEPEGQPDAVPSAGPSVPQSAQNNAQPAVDPLAAMIGKHADYYLAEFQKVKAGQKTRFNWAAFFLGPCMCFYRSCHELFKKYYLLYFILWGVSCVLFTVSSICMAGGAFGIGFALTGIYDIFVAVINTFLFIMQIRFGKNFNREYYNHCKQQMGLPASGKKAGTSAKKMWLFVLVVAVIWGVWYAATMLVTQQVMNSYMDSLWEDSSYSEDGSLQDASSYNYEGAASYTERPASSERQTASSTSEAITEYNLPVGTYQLWIGYGGTTASIRLWNEPSDPETPWYCDVILWNGIDAIVDEYYGSAYVSDDLQTIICGDYTFGIGYDGSVLVDDSLSDVPYDVIYYSGDTSMETGLNALIDISDEFTPVTKEAVDAYSDLYSLDRTIIHMSMY